MVLAEKVAVKVHYIRFDIFINIYLPTYLPTYGMYVLIHVYVSKLVSVYDIPASYTSTSHGAAIKVGPLMRTAYTRIDYDHPYAVPSNLHWRSYTTGPKEHPSTGARDWKMTQTLAKVTKHHSAHILLLGEEHSQKTSKGSLPTIFPVQCFTADADSIHNFSWFVFLDEYFSGKQVPSPLEL